MGLHAGDLANVGVDIRIRRRRSSGGCPAPIAQPVIAGEVVAARCPLQRGTTGAKAKGEHSSKSGFAIERHYVNLIS